MTRVLHHKPYVGKEKQYGHSKASAGEEKKKAFVKMVWNVIHYLIKTLLYHRFIRFPAGCHKLCTLVLNHFKLFLQPIDLLLEPLEE